MQKRCSVIILCSIVLCFSSYGFCTAESLQTQEDISSVGNLAEGKLADTNTPSEKSQQDVQEQDQVVKAKEDAKKAEIEAQTAKKEAEIQQETVELEKEKAEVKLKEAEVAKKEVKIVKELGENQEEIQKALEKAKQKEKEALAAKYKVALAEEAMLVAQEKAMVAEKELKIAQEKASVAEAKVGKTSNSMCTKLFQTALIIIGGYLAIFILVHIINRRIKDLKLRHSVRKYVVYFLNILIVLYVVFLWIQNISSITIFLSVISAGIALALQEVILSIAGWLLIFVRRPFQVGV